MTRTTAAPSVVAERAGRGRLVYEADLHLTVSDARGATTAHLGSDESGLVLDVEDTATLLRCVPGRGLTRDLPVRPPVELIAGSRVRLTSQGRDLGRAVVTTRGRLRLVPTPAGVVVLSKAAGSAVGRPTAARAALVLVTVAGVVAAVVVWVRHRQR